MSTLSFTHMETPVGPLHLVGGDAGLRGVLWPRDDPPAGAVRGPHPVLAEAERQLREYFAGERQAFDLPLDPVGTAFQLRCWNALAEIPYGATRTYGEQARLVGAGNPRAVGAANGQNPLSIVLPCHRVIGSNGSLTGYGGGLATKRALLDLESGALRLVSV